MSSREFQDRLARRAALAGVPLDDPLAGSLQAYYQLLAKWNAKINLTAFRLSAAGEDNALDRLIIEPLVAARYVAESARTVLDLGSGGGSPAIPMKLALPRLALRMVESRTRKVVFLREAIRLLGLKDATVEATRFEQLLARPELHEALDMVTLRAVRMDPRTLLTVQAFLKPGGRVFLFRGSGGMEVGAQTPPPLVWTATYPLVNALGSQLVVLSKTRL